SMPHAAYLTTYINPMHYFVDAIRTVFVRGGGLNNVAHQIMALLAFGMIRGAGAVRRYKKRL
ncbi:MAG: ABC transporter permease, partial [Prevotella sp.]|nr:ABC transporter permease [Prevotella sp.]